MRSDKRGLSNGFGAVTSGISWGNIIEIVIILVMGTIFITTTRNNLNMVQQTQEQFRDFHNVVIPNTYVRQDVLEERLTSIENTQQEIKKMLQEE